MKRRVRYAVVGLGYISQIAMLPAFRAAQRNSVLAALVSGSDEKLRSLGRRYKVGTLVGYEGYDALLASGDIDAVYIGLPNTMHRDMAVRAARAGIHVLCDKPLAMSAREGMAIVRAAAVARVRLMTAYRLHFEAGTAAALDMIHRGRIGRPRHFTADFAMQIAPGNIRTRSELGGGPLHDLGIYCVNAARHVFRAEPVEVFAQATGDSDPRFRAVEEMVAVLLRFPGGELAKFTCSFGAHDASVFQVWGSEGTVRLEDAFEMAGPKTLHATLKARGAPKDVKQRFPKVDQFAPLLLHFSDCILKRRQPVPSGDEGVADLRVLDAIRRSLDRRGAVALPHSRFLGPKLTARTVIRAPSHAPPKLLKAQKPSRDE